MASNTVPIWQEYNRRSRLLEIIPGFLTWSILLLPFILSIYKPIVVAFGIIMFDLLWLVRSVAISFYLIKGNSRLEKALKIQWDKKNSHIVDFIENRSALPTSIQDDFMFLSLGDKNNLINPKNLIHLIIIPIYNEDIRVLQKNLDSILRVNFDLKKIFIVITSEQRAGADMYNMVAETATKYKSKFANLWHVEHPDNIKGEVAGKGPNITYAATWLMDNEPYFYKNQNNLVVTTIDVDHQLHHNYLACLTYYYCLDQERLYRSYQPMALFHKNFWDAPMPLRLIATANSFWLLVESVRFWRLRNFAAQAQGLPALIKTNFWSKQTIVEDGHQYWRSYFCFSGKHSVLPIYIPIYQEIPLSNSLWKSFVNQYRQLNRWAWGISDFPYVVDNFKAQKKIKLTEKIHKTFLLLDGHVSWATASLIIVYVAWLPLLLNPNAHTMLLVHSLPKTVQSILLLSNIGIIITVYISTRMLPKGHPKGGFVSYLLIMLQWILLPVTSICFGAFAAITSQTKLMLGKKQNIFYVAEKVIKEKR